MDIQFKEQWDLVTRNNELNFRGKRFLIDKRELFN